MSSSDSCGQLSKAAGRSYLERIAFHEFCSFLSEGYKLMFRYKDSLYSLRHTNGNRIDIKVNESGLYIMKNGKILKHEMR